MSKGTGILPCDGAAVRAAAPDSPTAPTLLERGLRILTVVTMFMTVPQVVSVWSERGADGVSLVSWLAYLLSSFAWLVYGIQKCDRTIYLAFAGWIVLDAAIVAGIVVRG